MREPNGRYIFKRVRHCDTTSKKRWERSDAHTDCVDSLILILLCACVRVSCVSVCVCVSSIYLYVYVLFTSRDEAVGKKIAHILKREHRWEIVLRN